MFSDTERFRTPVQSVVGPRAVVTYELHPDLVLVLGHVAWTDVAVAQNSPEKLVNCSRPCDLRTIFTTLHQIVVPPTLRQTKMLTCLVLTAKEYLFWGLCKCLGFFSIKPVLFFSNPRLIIGYPCHPLIIRIIPCHFCMIFLDPLKNVIFVS